MWIPEVYCTENKNPNEFIVSNIESKRFRLKCAVCGSKNGACIQCAYGRCTVSAHPSCAISKTSGFSHRIIKSVQVNGLCEWEIFCTLHANSVKDAVKPKIRSKRTVLLHNNGMFSGNDEVIVNHNKGRSSSKGGKSSRGKGGKSSDFVSAMDSDNATQISVESDHKYLSEAPDFVGAEEIDVSNSPRRRRGRPPRPGRSSDAPDRLDRSDVSRANQPRGLVQISDDVSEYASVPEHDFSVGSTKDAFKDDYRVLTLSEWPGQAAGEGLDLAHFWNVVSMMYPEDRGEQVRNIRR